MNMNKNIGNSILPSSSPKVLTALPYKGGILVVVPDYELDTHHLEYRGVGVVKKLASHPNGHSCYALAERMVNKDVVKVKEQGEYIIRCGGSADLVGIESI